MSGANEDALDDGEQTHAARAIEAAAEAHDDATAFVRDASTSAAETRAAVMGQLRAHPYVSLGVVAGVGFVVAGGLATPAVRSLGRIGGRLLLTAVTRKLWALVLEAVPVEPDVLAPESPVPPRD